MTLCSAKWLLASQKRGSKEKYARWARNDAWVSREDGFVVVRDAT